MEDLIRDGSHKEEDMNQNIMQSPIAAFHPILSHVSLSPGELMEDKTLDMVPKLIELSPQPAHIEEALGRDSQSSALTSQEDQANQTPANKA